MAKGRLIQTDDDRHGIAYNSDQRTEWIEEDKLCVTMTDSNWRKKDEPKRLIKMDKLEFKGYVD